MMTRIPRSTLYACAHAVLQHSALKRRRFVESVEIMIVLKDFDPKKDPRIVGSVTLKHVPKPRLKVCVLADKEHALEAKANQIDYLDRKAIDMFCKSKKMVMKMSAKYSAFIASPKLIKKIPRVMSPGLLRAGKRPMLATHDEPLKAQIERAKCVIKVETKKSPCLGYVVGNVRQTADELADNLEEFINCLVSLLPKRWDNVRSLHTKSSMGPRHRIY